MSLVEVECPDCGKTWHLVSEYASDPDQCRCSSCFRERNGPPTVEKVVKLENGKELTIRSWR